MLGRKSQAHSFRRPSYPNVINTGLQLLDFYHVLIVQQLISTPDSLDRHSASEHAVFCLYSQTSRGQNVFLDENITCLTCDVTCARTTRKTVTFECSVFLAILLKLLLVVEAMFLPFVPHGSIIERTGTAALPPNTCLNTT